MTDQQDRLSPVVENRMGPAPNGEFDEPERAGRSVEPTDAASSGWIPAAGRVIDNPISGERIVIRESGAQTGGRLLAFDLFLPPGAHVPARHVHPVQEEQFTVVAGQMRFRLGRFGRRTILAQPGDMVRVPPGTAHWFGNAGAGVAHARVEVRPALRMEDLFESAAAMGGTRLFPGARLPRLSDLALFLLEFHPAGAGRAGHALAARACHAASHDAVRGISFRPPQVNALGLDARMTLRTLLTYPFQLVRLGAYWKRMEPEPGRFRPDEIDGQVDAAERAGKQIILCVGASKTFGYPEFFVPAHQLQQHPLREGALVEPAAHASLRAAATAFVTRIVERYRDCKAIIAWQVEHEAVDALGMEHSWRLAAAFVQQEVAAVREADPTRPIMMNGLRPDNAGHRRPSEGLASKPPRTWTVHEKTGRLSEFRRSQCV
jgi:quercetin dioxygenase-like cupin family protein